MDGTGTGAALYAQYAQEAKSAGRAPLPSDEPGELPELPPVSAVSSELMDWYLAELFRMADANGNGVLELDEFVAMFGMSGFEFGEGTLRSMFAIADLDGDGVVQLSEAVPYMRAVLTDQQFSAPVVMPRLSELSPELLDRYLTELFRTADANRDGVLQQHEFVQMLKLSGFNFGEGTVHGMLMLADTNGDGVLQIEEAVPYLRCMIMDMAFESLPPVSAVSSELMDWYLAELFRMADANGNGVLELDEFVAMFGMSGFEFGEGTLRSMFAIADLDGDGVVQLSEAVPYMRAVLTDQQFSAPVVMPRLSELSPELLDRYLTELFRAADTNQDGVLQQPEFVEMLGLARFGFTRSECEAMFAIADSNHDG